MRLIQYFLAVVFLTVFAAPAKAMFNTFEVGTGTIASTFNPNPSIFTTIDFAEEFSATPIVFVLPSTQGGDECDVRIQNVSTTGFEAYCTEAPPRDGRHVAMDIQYVAILPGVTTVPSSAGPIIFEAGTVDTMAVQHNCAPTCGAESWALVDPTSVDPASAAIIGQIQTTENESGNPPSTASQPFLSTAIGLNEGTADEFGLALERSEVDEGTVTTDETIGWLAVQNTGASCVTLDLSTLGGPVAVPFQSIITDDLAQGAAGGDIHGPADGWDDGCNANEGAEFAAMCFSNTPVVVANKRTRNGADGGWLRQCNISTNEIRLTVDEDRSGDDERNHTAEGVSALAFGISFNTPVALSHIDIQQLDRNVSFKWETSTETHNIGFNLWGEINGRWQQLNRRLIPSVRKDQLQPNSYSRNVRLSRYEYGEMTKFGISSVDVNGKDEFYGPFEAGESYGQQIIPLPIDWSDVKAQYVQRMQSKGYRLVNGVWRKSRTKQAQLDANENAERVDLSISETGVYRISFDDLQALGVNWQNVDTRQIAVTHKGRPVARYISGKRGKFSADNAIEFFATVPLDEDARYIETNTYQLQLDRSLALNMPIIQFTHSDDDEGSLTTLGLDGARLTEDRVYQSLAAGDPWMDAEIFSVGFAAEQVYTVTLDEIDSSAVGRLSASLVGGVDFPNDSLDHHVMVYVNDVLIADQTADGFSRFEIDAPVPAGVLTNGDNTVKIVLPGDTGHFVDIVNVDSIELFSATQLSWSALQPKPLEFVGPKDAERFAVGLGERFQRRNMRAYITQENGNATRVAWPRQAAKTFGQRAILPTTALHADLTEDSHYWLGNIQQMLTPEMEIVQSKTALVSDKVDYIIVAHPAFINADLEQFAESKTNEGLWTEIVSWLDIVEQYGYGLATPDALRQFLTEVNLQVDYQYVLLVGGHSYDYLDYLGNGSVNFIPAWYRKVDIIQQAPTDTPYVDLNADGLPQKAIGRWPVRTEADLAAIIDKTNEWQENGISESRSSLFVAGKTEANRDYGQLLTNAMTPVTNRWDNIQQVFLDDVIAQEGSNANAVARQSILDTVDQGVSLTVFHGHASPSAWALDSLLTSADITALSNSGLPTLLLTLACYTTYYETPAVDSLAHQWLFSEQQDNGTRGAVGIHGASVFSDFRENNRFAQRVLRRQLEQNLTLGQAILSVKRRLSPWHNMVNNWALLGDPSLSLRP